MTVRIDVARLKSDLASRGVNITPTRPVTKRSAFRKAAKRLSLLRAARQERSVSAC